jgi:hypothetical protein
MRIGTPCAESIESGRDHEERFASTVLTRNDKGLAGRLKHGSKGLTKTRVTMV